MKVSDYASNKAAYRSLRRIIRCKFVVHDHINYAAEDVQEGMGGETWRSDISRGP